MIDLDRFRDGDRSYLGELVKANEQLVYGVVKEFAHGGDEADDLFQNVWVKMIEDRASYLGWGPFEAWLHRLALNVCRLHARRRAEGQARWRRLAEIGFLEDLSWVPSNPLSGLLSEERRSKVQVMLEDLPDREKEAMRLRVIQARPTREVAQMMEIEESTVRSLVRKGKDRLRKHIKESVGDLSGS